MKYGNWARNNSKLNPIAIPKKQRDRKKDLKKLTQLFPKFLKEDLQSVYSQCGENFQETLDKLSEMNHEEETETPEVKFLEEMFNTIDKDYVNEVYNGCNQDISQATAFLLETSHEEDEDSKQEFGNETIGYVNNSAIERRIFTDYVAMLEGSYPTISRSKIRELYNKNNQDLINTISDLDEEILRTPEPNLSVKTPQSKKRPKEDFPSLGGVPQPKQSAGGYWNRHSQNYFLEGNNTDSVEKILKLKRSFPAVDDVIIKEIFFSFGDSYEETLAQLLEMFPENYRELPQSEGPLRIPHPKPEQPVHQPRKPFDFDLKPKMKDEEFKTRWEEMQHSRQLHDGICQAASSAVAAGNFEEARRLSSEAKKYIQKSERIYQEVYPEVFARNNRDFGSLEKVDLHGLRTNEALEILARVLETAKQSGVLKIEVVTGKGLHSNRGIAKLKPAVENFLNAQGYKKSNLEGGFKVHLNK